MLSRHTLIFKTETSNGEFTLEQRLAGQATSCTVWLKITGFLLANVLTNSFSLVGLVGDAVPSEVLISICAISGIATIYANFISKTVVACNPIDSLHLSTNLKRLYERLDIRIKENKDRYDIKDTVLVIDKSELKTLREPVIDHPGLREGERKFDIVMRLLANRYGSISIISPEEVKTDDPNQEMQRNLIVAVTSRFSDEMSDLISDLPRGAKAFNYDSHWEGINRKSKCTDFWVSFPRWICIKGLPSLVLLNQGITTTLSLLEKIPGFSTTHWGIQIGSMSLTMALVAWSRIDINNVLKGDRAIAETNALGFTLSKLYKSCCARPAPLDAKNDKTLQPYTLQVSHAVAITAVIVALASVGFTVYYNYATARFYSPSQAMDLLVKQLNKIPDIDKAPHELIDLGLFIRDLQCTVLYPGQIVSSVVLSFLTSCKSTLDRVLNWLYKPAKNSKSFCQKETSEKLFTISNMIDCNTFGVNAAFNSYSINDNIVLAMLTGVGIVITSLVWGSETKNIPIAHAIIRCGLVPELEPVLLPASTMPLTADIGSSSDVPYMQVINDDGSEDERVYSIAPPLPSVRIPSAMWQGRRVSESLHSHNSVASATVTIPPP